MYGSVIIISAIVISFIVYMLLRRRISDNGNTADELRDNNKRAEDINRKSSVIIEHISDEIGEATKLNNDIRADNKTAKDIFKQIRNQKLDW